ncbi:MAG: NAD(P)-dependent oxidoreductase [Clostridia bacterium]|nr:NAD(P)-dependent oxidoreductase [Clostridia bacterium]
MILVVGSGFLGSYVLQVFAARTNEKIIGTVRDIGNHPQIDGVDFIECDVTKSDDLNRLASLCGHEEKLTVFYFAAVHNIDFIFDHPQEAKDVNITALNSFFDVMPHIDKLFFSSTDCVYGENPKGELLSESSPLYPVNKYGIQKREAELIVIDHGCTCARLPFMIGPSLTSKPHFYDVIRQKLAKAEPVEMIDGMVRSVLSYRQCAELLYEVSLLQKESIPPVINICGDEQLTKYETGVRLAREFGADESLIIKISEEEGKKFFRDKRASSTAMDNKLLKSLTGKEKITWEVKEC